MRPFGKVTQSRQRSLVVGEVRKTQLITTHGPPGSIVDFVNETAMIAGIDNWDWSIKDLTNPPMWCIMRICKTCLALIILLSQK